MNAAEKVSNASPPITPPIISPVVGLDVEELEGSEDVVAIGSGVTAKKSRKNIPPVGPDSRVVISNEWNPAVNPCDWKNRISYW